MEVGSHYELTCIPGVSNTNYPHKNDDLLVNKQVINVNAAYPIHNVESEMYAYISTLAKVTVESNSTAQQIRFCHSIM